MDASQERRRGRPRDPRKRDALLIAARKLFLSHGVQGVPLDAIAMEAKVSKATLYSHYPDRSSILEAVIERESERIVTQEQSTVSREDPVEEALTAFGHRLLHFLSDPEMLRFECLIAEASSTYPDLPGRFYEAGPGRALRVLEAIITVGIETESLRPLDPKQAAEDLVGLWQGTMRLKQTMGSHPAPSSEDLHARSVRGVKVFMGLYSA